jgi:hypothetical protein
MNTTVEVVITFDEYVNELKNNFLSLFPEDLYIRLLIVAMALVVGYGINRILTDTPNAK